MRRTSLVAALALFVALPAAPALASFHLIYVVGVFTGSEAAPDAQYIQLQAYAGGQNVLSGHTLTVFDTDGNLVPGGTFTFASSVANSADQMYVLLATTHAQTLFSMSADMTIPAILPPGGGKVCWNGTAPECVAWGGYSGPMAGVTTPFNAPVGIPPGKAINRRLNICLGATNLDACDDTQNSSSDFVLAVPAPHNNFGTTGSLPSQSCANGSLEGLEGCDDGNSGNGDGCAANCTLETGTFTAQALAVDPSSSATSDGNHILEPGESVFIQPSWKNIKTSTLPFRGFVSSWTSGVPATYSAPFGQARYGPLLSNATGTCTLPNCPEVGISFSGARPQVHIDVPLVEVLSNGDTKTWQVHVGQSFTDVVKTSPFYKFIEAIVHKQVTAGCGPTTYCPSSSTSRQQMAVFVLVSKEGAAYSPPPCVTPPFADVPCSNPFAKFIQELAARGVVSGCGGGNYCPTTAVTRDQMAVFLLRTQDPVFTPPACTTPIFTDVPCSNPFAKWINELSNRGIVTGCGGGNYCPTSPVTREQMGVFLATTFSLTLYGP